MNAVFQEKLDNMLRQGREEGCFPSAACAIGVKDEVLAESFVGEAPLPGDAPVDAHTRYDMASLSKILGPTMIALKALEDGTLKLDDTVGGEFPFAPADKRDITVKMLMTHTGGLYPDFKLEQLIDTPDKTLECILNHPLQQAPGTVPAYSCMGYILLTKMLEHPLWQALGSACERARIRPAGHDRDRLLPARLRVRRDRGIQKDRQAVDWHSP